jgi:hypothetical protein
MKDKPSGRMRVHWICGVVLLTLTAAASEAPLSLSAQSPIKKPWQYTDDERLAMRFEVASMQARLESALADDAVDEGELRDVVEGSKNPELFMPWELYRTLLTAAFSSNPDARKGFRDNFEPWRKALGLPEDFWDRLGSHAEPYLSWELETRSLGAEMMAAQGKKSGEIERLVDTRGLESCRLRIETFEAARKAFGRERLDRFLYEAVAPGLGLSAADSTASLEQLRFLAGGCR